MRTDAKIGFAIVGVLVAVLMGFFVVNSRHNSKLAQGPKTAEGGGVVLAPTTPSTTTTDITIPPPPVVTSPAKSNDLPPTPPVSATADLARNNKPPAVGPVDPLVDPIVPDLVTDPTRKGGHGKPEIAKNTDPVGKVTGKRKATHGDTALAAGQRYYTVRAGQTLSSIASDMYGDPHAWQKIKDANPTLNPKRLRVGTQIVLPDPASVRPHPGVVVPAADVIYADASPAGTSSITAGDSYVVQPGDTLYKLAKRFLGSGAKADALYELNRDVIGSSPSRLKRGMVLRLPTAAGALSDASR